MMNRIELKQYAKNRVKGRRLEIWRALIFIFLGSMIVTLFTPTVDYNIIASNYLSTNDLISISRTTIISSLITSFLLQPLNYGINQYLMDFDKNDYGSKESVFSFYKDIIKIFVLSTFISIVVQCVVIFIALIFIIGSSSNLMNVSLIQVTPFIVIGELISVYLSYCFAAVPFIFKENREKSIIEIMKLSNQMMRGHKFEYFILSISFVGWYFLSLLSFGVLLVWVLPYNYFTLAKYFLDLKNNYYGIDDKVEANEDSTIIE